MHARSGQNHTPISRVLRTRRRLLAAFAALLAAVCFGPAASVQAGAPATRVLIAADEIPAMQVLADRMKAEEQIESTIVTQDKLPAELAPFAAVLVYIHRGLDEAAEMAFIKYARQGGKLIVLHHSISSGKRKNKEWFKFLGVDLPAGEADQGGYKWTEGVTMAIVNLAPKHFITTNKLEWPEKIGFKPAEGEAAQALPGVTLHETEVYLNHVLKGERTPLLGLKYTDPKTGKTWMQSHAGWIKKAEQGTVIYLLPGHSEMEFKNAAYGRIVINAVICKQ